MAVESPSAGSLLLHAPARAAAAQASAEAAAAGGPQEAGGDEAPPPPPQSPRPKRGRTARGGGRRRTVSGDVEYIPFPPSPTVRRRPAADAGCTRHGRPGAGRLRARDGGAIATAALARTLGALPRLPVEKGAGAGAGSDRQYSIRLTFS